jgi:hypothetical protein
MSRLVDYFVVVGYDFDKQREFRSFPAYSGEFLAPDVQKRGEANVQNSIQSQSFLRV